MSDVDEDHVLKAKGIEVMEALRETMASIARQNDAMDALIAAVPHGLTQNELRDLGRNFAALTERAGPRRGLCRFGDDG